MHNDRDLLKVSGAKPESFALRCSTILFTEDEFVKFYLKEPEAPLRNSDRLPLYCEERFDKLKGKFVSMKTLRF